MTCLDLHDWDYARLAEAVPLLNAAIFSIFNRVILPFVNHFAAIMTVRPFG
jgi:hypothetical protein